MHRLSKNHTPASSKGILHFQHTKRKKCCEFQFCMVVSALVWLLMVYARVTCIRPSYFIAYIFSIAYTRRVLAHAWTLQSHQSHWFCTYFCYNCNDSHRILVWKLKVHISECLLSYALLKKNLTNNSRHINVNQSSFILLFYKPLKSLHNFFFFTVLLYF